MRPIPRYRGELEISEGQLAATTRLDSKLVKAIMTGNFTSSPSQRQRLAASLGIQTEDTTHCPSLLIGHPPWHNVNKWLPSTARLR
jgi:hypothetical protein